MLDPELHEELRIADKTVLVLHIAMLSEPIIYVIVALVLREVSGFRGLEENDVCRKGSQKDLYEMVTTSDKLVCF